VSARRCVLVALIGCLAAAGPARAQGPVYVAQPPTAGALYADGQTGRYLLGGTWLYRADPGNTGVAEGWNRNVAATDGWSPVSVPNSYNAGDFSNASMNGTVGWYRRDFTLPAGAFARYVSAASRRWIIRFESVNYRATVWLNGRQIGTHAGAYLPFEFDLTGLRPGVNRLIVRVDDRRGPGDLPPGPGGGWWNFGGIQREVYLRAAQRVDLQQVQVRPVLPCPTCPATIEEQATVRNVSSFVQTVQLRGFYGGARVDFGTTTLAPHASWLAQTTVRIAHPRLWSIDRPNLYRASLTVSDSRGRRLGGYVTESGIRSIQVVGGRLTLNGRPLSLRGVNVHEQDIVEGAALDPAHLSRLVGWARALGATVIRAHYPLNPEIEELADRDGILLWSEIPVYGTDGAYLDQPEWLARAEAMLKTNILTNQNHPSVMLWSIANELATPVSGPEARYIAAAAALAHKLDPTRPVGDAILDWPGVACQKAYGPLDVIGYNDYFGWFDSGVGASEDRDALGPFLDSLRACYPTKAIMISEFGFEGSRHGPVEERGTYEFQANSMQFHLNVFASKPWLSGAIWFPLQDFAAKPGWGGGDPWPNPPFVQKGMFDLYGNEKPGFAVMSSIYHGTVQIAPARDSKKRRAGRT
jgi:Glycosyl hydrolases family 2, TIM barrel domain/Glycosyl hydrolases family 2, sugar binding domain/Glycosyl hydrolases family 2